MTGGFWIESPPISWILRVTAGWFGWKEIIRHKKMTEKNGWELQQNSPTG